MFDDFRIDNDYKYVLRKMEEYEKGDSN